jgi:hypothetical protein
MKRYASRSNLNFIKSWAKLAKNKSRRRNKRTNRRPTKRRLSRRRFSKGG